MYLYNGEYGVVTDENGLYYMRARYYNSEIKRFVNQDVLTGTISDSPTMNRYAYVNGNPISLADPFGLSPSLNWLGHAALDVLGLIPVVGFVFDAVNAVWYFAEGDIFAGVCSLIAALPGVGDAVALIGKGSTFACKLAKGIHITANAGAMLKSTYVVGNVVKTNIDRYLINGEEFSLSQLGVDLFTVGLEIFAFKNAAKGLADAQSQSWCFVAGTLVATEAGYKTIEEIQVGDVVLAEDTETGEVAYKTVEETFVNETNELVHVHVNGETISATPTHPFYVNQFGWTRAADLRAGDVLVLSNGEYVVVEFVQHEILEKPVKVYNFEVEDYHTYFVGEVSVLVHNGCEDDVVGNEGSDDFKPMTWNEFQHANKGKTNAEMSEAWNQYKQANYPNAGEHYLKRPYLRKETVDGITRGRGENGVYFDANTLEVIDGTPDIGHVYGREFWRERDMAESLGWTQSQFNDYMNDSTFYQYESPSSNRSHKYEKK